jgi:hypothetical protein
MRMPSFGLAEWQRGIDLMQQDGANLLLLWMGGAFRSARFPVTWQFNAEHANVQEDFGRELIAHAHRRGLKVLLGFTPFGYDGVNQYPRLRPELKAVKRGGGPVDESGIYCWGWNLCPAKAESQRFMGNYVREMFFDFYPEADGLMIESSDYAICHCGECGERFYDREFEFVQTLSAEVWRRKPAATIIVYPHYFSGKAVPGFEVTGARRPFDRRWTLFFTPHSAHLDAGLIQQARASLWWDESPALRGPEAIREGARRAQAARVTGYVPSLEAYSFIPYHIEEGEPYLVGKRQVPLGFGWLAQGQLPYDELPMRVNRIAYREFCRQPELSLEDFNRRLGQEVFGRAAPPQASEDLLALHKVFFTDRSWCQSSPLVCPDRLRARQKRGDLKPAQLAQYRLTLRKVREIADRYREAAQPNAKELSRLAAWVVGLWEKPDNALLLAEP